MSLISISLDDSPISFEPAGEAEEIIQNVKTILKTSKYTVPLNREFGVAGDMVDKPIHQAAAFFQQAIVQAINKYEPRAEVLNVSFEGSQPLDGVLMPTVTCRLRLSNG